MADLKRIRDYIQQQLYRFYSFLKRKHQEKVTVMLIPHTEKKIINFHISVLTISIFLIVAGLSIFIASVNIVGRSSIKHSVKELELSNSEYKEQRQKIREEIKPIFALITEFTELTGQLLSNASGKDYAVDDAIGGPEAEDLLDDSGFSDELPDVGPEKTGSGIVDISSDAFTGGPSNYNLPAEIAILKQGIHNLELTNAWGKKTIKLLEKQKTVIRHSPTIWPVKGHIINPYGPYVDPYTGRESFNRGLDIGTLPGSEVLVTADGIVHQVYEHARYGYTVEVKHRWGFKTIYSSLERVTVKKEEKIQKGDVIGFVGRTGFSHSPSLHYELWVGTTYIDPFPFLNKLVD